MRRGFREDRHVVDRFEGGEHLGPLFLRKNRTIRGLAERTDAVVAVDGDDQAIPFASGHLQRRDVTDVEHVETAVGEDDPLTEFATGVDLPADLFERAELAILAMTVPCEQIGEDLAPTDVHDADLLDFESARHVGEPRDRPDRAPPPLPRRSAPAPCRRRR